MKKNNLIYIIFLILITSCVSLKPANTLNKAENRIIKYNTGIKNQIDKYPQLVDKAYKIIVKDTVRVGIDSSKFKSILFDLEYLRNINSEYETIINNSNVTIDSLLKLPIKDYPKECEQLVSDFNKRIARLGEEFSLQQKLTIDWRNKYEEVLNDSVIGKYEDDKFIINYIYSSGEIELDVLTKDKYIIVDKEEYTYDISIRKEFWQDFKFYIFLSSILVIIYFFGKELQSILNSILNAVLTIIRKLLIKI